MNKQLSLFSASNENSFARIVSTFSHNGSRTETQEIDGVTYFTNEFWTARQRQAHRIHEISYRACFKPQLPAFFIEHLTKEGDMVYDPFMGRGTTPVEAAIRGRVPVGNDTNPLSRAFTEPRLHAPSLMEVQTRLAEIPWESFNSFENTDLLVFYHPETLAKIEGLRTWMLNRLHENKIDYVDLWIRMVALNRLTGHSSGFFSVYTLPPNQATSLKSQQKINSKRNQTPPLRDVSSIILKKSKILLSDGRPIVYSGMLLTQQSDKTYLIPNSSIDLTVTSPPFLDIVNYEADNWLRCWFIDVNPREVNISSYRSIADWEDFICRTLGELARVTKPGGHIAFEVGEVRHGTIRLEAHVLRAAKHHPLIPLGVLINQQNLTKTSNCWGVSNNQGGTNTNRIVVLRRT